MKKLLLLLCYTIFGYAHNQELFLQANECYKQKEYQKALELYHTIEKKGCATWYNMGNCSYCLGDKQRALIYWQMANRGANPVLRRSIIHNCNCVQEQDAGLTTESVFHEIASWLGLYSSYISLFMWQVGMLSAWFLLWYVVASCRKYRKLIVFLISINIVCGLFLLMRYLELHRLQGCVTQPGITIFAGPNKDYHAIGVIDQIARVKVNCTENEWCQICYKQLIGWVPAAKLEMT